MGASQMCLQSLHMCAFNMANYSVIVDSPYVVKSHKNKCYSG